jgi:hypothetical protein
VSTSAPIGGPWDTAYASSWFVCGNCRIRYQGSHTCTWKVSTTGTVPTDQLAVHLSDADIDRITDEVERRMAQRRRLRGV